MAVSVAAVAVAGVPAVPVAAVAAAVVAWDDMRWPRLAGVDRGGDGGCGGDVSQKGESGSSRTAMSS